MPKLNHARLLNDPQYGRRALDLVFPIIADRLLSDIEAYEPPTCRDDEDPERWDGQS